jgi:CubicO group peptidase (beta-lactamase class C family)
LPLPVSEALLATLERRLRLAQVERRLPSVSAAVFSAGDILWQQALGLADVAGDEPATPDHAYRVGSITKTFTAVAIMQLREAGIVELDAPLSTYVDGLPGGPTVRQALSHSSGLQREAPGAMWETMEAPTREELLASLPDAELVLRPGRLWHYSNLAFALLGEVIARHGGSYESVLCDRVLEPLGLGRTRLRPDTPYATPYFVDPYADRVRVEPNPEVTELTGAAGWLWSTTADLARWADFICTGAGDVLHKGVLDEMARVHAMVDEERWEKGWGLGLELFRRGDRVFTGHTGAMPGFLAAFCVHRAERTGAAILTNSGAGADVEALALDLACTALDALPRSPEPWHTGSEVPPDVESLLGRWWTEGDEVVFSWVGGRLQAELVGGPAGLSISLLEPDGDGRWRVAEGRERGELVCVVRDSSGAVEKLTFATYPLTRHPSTFGT